MAIKMERERCITLQSWYWNSQKKVADSFYYGSTAIAALEYDVSSLPHPHGVSQHLLPPHGTPATSASIPIGFAQNLNLRYTQHPESPWSSVVQAPYRVPPAARPQHRRIEPGPCDTRLDRSAAVVWTRACQTALEICSRHPGASHHPTHITSAHRWYKSFLSPLPWNIIKLIPHNSDPKRYPFGA